MPRADRNDHPAEASDLGGVADLLWRTGADRREDARPRLNARRIVAAAVGIADAEGLDVVSMQRVASELGYTTTALYRHIPSKEHLVAAMVDTATGSPPSPSSGPRVWRTEVELWVLALWNLYLRRPWMMRAPTLSAPVGPNELAWFEALLSPLARAGLDRTELVPIATFISSAVRDLARVATELDPAGAAAYHQVLGQRLNPEHFPVLCSLAAGDGLDEEEDGDVTPIVRYGIERLLDGIEVRLESTTKHPKEKRDE
ncbi:TetR/AcrR family transcriptional regulator [Micromonospora ureilytica]|uniref:TetR/AcrR family transcriptional regulator n=1 Tax=Micromonospora ureilytica TaxID=709868 RepID=UPI002E15883C|nr:TetR/AcrR family transcriptional regulator [Micromonospora ureilytica]